MPLKSINPTHTKAWHKLNTHFNDIKEVPIKQWFSQNNNRVDDLSLIWEDFYVDLSKNKLSKETLDLLISLAHEVDLKDAITKYFKGDLINHTEGRAVLHTALRVSRNSSVLVNNQDIIPNILETKTKIKAFSDGVIHGDLKGYTGKAFTDIVNIGIGGSHLGPEMVIEALQFYKNHLRSHFISNIDGDHSAEILKQLNPETTLFIVVSKTFTTQETLTNANTIKSWFLNTAPEQAISKHFIAISTNTKAVTEFGISTLFPVWDWVGGRFSLWSSVGLIISLSVGYNNFERLLGGAHHMDKHFENEDFEKNLPVVLALVSVWYRNFFNTETEAVIPYSHYLSKFVPYLQQTGMESNGKSVDRSGHFINYKTGSIIWGEVGSNAQHSFFQLLHQGTTLIPTDFIVYANSLYKYTTHHNALYANCIAQSEALLNGKSSSNPYTFFEGDKPTTSIVIKQLTPESLGKLIALYEHKTFVLGVIYNIYSFDQFGVELGKALTNILLRAINDGNTSVHDASTHRLLEYYQKMQQGAV